MAIDRNGYSNYLTSYTVFKLAHKVVFVLLFIILTEASLNNKIGPCNEDSVYFNFLCKI